MEVYLSVPLVSAIGPIWRIEIERYSHADGANIEIAESVRPLQTDDSLCFSDLGYYRLARATFVSEFTCF